MTKETAKQILDSVRDGKDVTVEQINVALKVTGDLK
jgi:hypothetical protein